MRVRSFPRRVLRTALPRLVLVRLDFDPLLPGRQCRDTLACSFVARQWARSANSVEKLRSDMCCEVFRGLPTITRVTIVDPGPF